MKMPERTIIEGVELTVPQDMYITKDRKTFEEKILMFKLAELMHNLGKKEKKEEKKPIYPFPPILYRDPIIIYKDVQPWSYYWDHVHRQRARWQVCQKAKTEKEKRT